jgi:putative CocE/NonD family hydrolase
VYETGTNIWKQHDAWPPKNSKALTMYFSERGSLIDKSPSEEGAFDEYISDPAKPVPFVDRTDIGMLKEYMSGDQRHAARRPDVVVYQSYVLTEDVTIAGPIRAKLHVSTSGTDSDWVVKIIDVYPPDFPDPDPNPTRVRMGGYQQLIRGDVFRGRFRNSYSKPEPFTPNEPTLVNVTLPDVCHTFRAGHRIMVQVQSTWFPLVDRNPQKFVDNINFAKESDFQKATQRVHRSAKLPSAIEVLVQP